MIQNYVVSKEKGYYAVSLIFSVFVWALLASGIGFTIYLTARAPRFDFSGDSPLGGESTADDSAWWDETPSLEESAGAPLNDLGADATSEFAEDYAGGESEMPPDEVVATEEAAGGDEVAGDETAGDDALSDDSISSRETEGYDFSQSDFSTDAYAPSLLSAGPSLVTLALVVVYVLLLVFIVLFGQIIAVGHLMGNGVRVSEKQFPELWAIFTQAASALGIKKLPSFYLVESGGMLNAFATRLFTRNYVALYTDLAECLYEGDEASVSFVIAHELIHVKRNHMIKGIITLPATMIPFLRQAWKRACEYSCDLGASMFAPSGAEKGLTLLAAGKKLSARMSADAYIQSFDAEKSAWKRFAELFASHPHLPKRIKAAREGASRPIGG